MTVPQGALATESDLVVRAQDGDSGAWDELVQRHRKPAYLLALQLTGNPDDALDLSQDAMLSLITHIGSLDSSRPVRPWLFTVVRNRTRDLWRRRKVRRAEPLAVEVGPALGHQIVDQTADPERDAVEDDRRRRVWRALVDLAEAHREILVLRDFHDLSYAEIAQILGIPLGTVMSRLHTARKKLRAIYLEETRNRP